MNRLSPVVLLVALAVMWGALFVPIKYGVERYPTLLFVDLRLIFGLAVLSPLLLVLRRSLGGPGLAVAAIGIGSLYGLGFILQSYGLIATGAGKGAFLIGLYVVFVPIIDAVMFRARIGAIGKGAVALAVLGLALQNLDDTAALGAVGSGDVLCLLSGGFYAAHIVCLARFCGSLDSLTFTWWQLVAITPLIGLLSLLVEGPPQVTGELLILSLATGVAANVVGLAGMVWAEKRISATLAGLVLATEPIYAAALSWQVDGETFSTRQLLGMALGLTAMVAMPLDGRWRGQAPAISRESPAAPERSRAAAPWP